MTRQCLEQICRVVVYKHRTNNALYEKILITSTLAMLCVLFAVLSLSVLSLQVIFLFSNMFRVFVFLSECLICTFRLILLIFLIVLICLCFYMFDCHQRSESNLTKLMIQFVSCFFLLLSLFKSFIAWINLMWNVLSLKFTDSTLNVACLVNVSISVNRESTYQSTSHIEPSDQTQKNQPT